MADDQAGEANQGFTKKGYQLLSKQFTTILANILTHPKDILTSRNNFVQWRKSVKTILNKHTCPLGVKLWNYVNLDDCFSIDDYQKLLIDLGADDVLPVIDAATGASTVANIQDESKIFYRLLATNLIEPFFRNWVSSDIFQRIEHLSLIHI